MTVRLGFEAAYLWACGRTGRLPVERNILKMRNLIDQLVLTPGGHAIAEAGVQAGMSGMLLAMFGNGSEYHGFDWFQGLEAGPHDDAKKARPGLFAFPESEARANLACAPACIVHTGRIPEVFANQPERAYRFAAIDVDCYEPTLASLRYFWPLLVPGGRMLCDDLAWEGAKRACLDFGEPYSVLDGDQQALWIKEG